MDRYIMELTFYHVLKLWFADVHRFHDVFWQARISVRAFWLVGAFDAAIWSWKPKSKHRQVQIEKKGKKMKVARRYFIKWKFFC